MKYLKEGKRRCDRLVWQLYNKNDKLEGTRLTYRGMWEILHWFQVERTSWSK